MKRRTWLQLSAASAAVLLIVGGTAALIEPGLKAGRLSGAGKDVFTAAGRALLDGSLPAEEGAKQIALNGLLERIDGLVAALPAHAQDEISQLLALLATTPGRLGLAGLGQDWSTASVAQIQTALQGMRSSSLGLKQQAYHALHDIVGGAYFSDTSTWKQLGYPGPTNI
jgi:hypothetical protein